MEDKDEIHDLICHYQKNLIRSAEKNNEEKMLYYINKLKRLPMTVSYLQQTGVGKTVNGVRRMGGEVAKLAKSVILYWKEVVENESKAQRDEEEGYESEATESPRQKEEKYTKIKNDHYSTVSNSHHKHSHRENHKTSRYSINTQEESNRSSENNNSGLSVKGDREENQKQKEYAKKKLNEHEESSSSNSSSTNSKSNRKSDHSKSSSSSKSNSRHSSHSSTNNSKNEKSLVKEKKSHHSKSKSFSKENSSHSKKRKTDKSSTKISDGGIDCGSGTSFAEALGMLEPSSSSKIKRKEKNSTPLNSENHNRIGLISSPKETTTDAEGCLSPSSEKTSPLLSSTKLEPLDINLSSLLPEITPHYRPLGNNTIDMQSLKMKKLADYEALSAGITSKTQRTKVYSGNKSCWGVSSLFDMCIRILQENIDALEYTGGVPYSILKPVLDRCTPDQLFMMEHYNPYLIEDTDELWKFHCQKEFRTKKREEMETWRDMYMRCLDEREAKLKALTSNIKQSQEKSQPVRQTMLAYVDSVAKPPRNVARKQVKNGIDNKPVMTPSSRLSALATSGDAGKVCVPNPGKLAVTSSVNSGSSNHTSVLKPKKAPLMQKALALIKNRYRR